MASDISKTESRSRRALEAQARAAAAAAAAAAQRTEKPAEKTPPPVEKPKEDVTGRLEDRFDDAADGAAARAAAAATAKDSFERESEAAAAAGWTSTLPLEPSLANPVAADSKPGGITGLIGSTLSDLKAKTASLLSTLGDRLSEAVKAVEDKLGAAPDPKKTEPDKKAKAASDAEKERQAEMDRLLKNDTVREGMKKLGLSDKEIREAGAGALKLLEAARLAGEGKYEDAARALLAAGKASSTLVAKAASNLAEHVKNPTLKALLKSADFVKALVGDPASAKAVEHLIKGEIGDALKALARNTAALSAAVDALKDDKSFKKALEAIGVDPEALKKNLDAVPDLVDAALKALAGDPGGALKSLVEAGRKAPEVLSEVIANYAKKLPDKVPGAKYLRAIFGDKDAVAAMLKDRDGKVAAGVKKLLDGDLSGLKDLAGSDAAEKAIKALAREPGIASALARLGLTGDDLAQLAKTAPEVFDALAALGKTPPDLAEAGKSLLAALRAAPGVAAKLIAKMADAIPANGPLGFMRGILKNPELVSALLADAKLGDALGRLLGGDMSAVKDVLTNPAVLKALAQSPQINELLGKLGLKASDLPKLAAALPDVLAAAQKIGDLIKQGKLTDALAALKDLAGKLDPTLAGKVLAGLAKTLGPGLKGPLKALLTDPNFMSELLTSSGAAWNKLMAGDAPGALKALAGNEKLLAAAANALFNDPDTRAALKKLGINSVAELKALGAAAGSVLDAVQKAEHKDFSGAIAALKEAWDHLSTDQKQKLFNSVVDALPVKEGFKEALKGLKSLVDRPGFKEGIAKVLEAAKSGDKTATIDALVDLGKSLPDDAKVAFLNALGKLPGSLGALFRDGALNEAIVHTKAFDELLDVAKSLAHRDIKGALGHLADAMKKLANDGKPLELAGVTLPFSKAGLGNMKALAERVWDALPAAVKERLKKPLEELKKKIAGKAIPVLGILFNAYAAGKDARALYDELHKANPDPTKLLLISLGLGADVAGIFGQGSWAAPLGGGAAALQILLDLGGGDPKDWDGLLDLAPESSGGAPGSSGFMGSAGDSPASSAAGMPSSSPAASDFTLDDVGRMLGIGADGKISPSSAQIEAARAAALAAARRPGPRRHRPHHRMPRVGT